MAQSVTNIASPVRTVAVENPILRGFAPDPSIARVGQDFYIATSTFDWFPGVQLFHSRDLRNWRLAARPLDRVSQLNMRGNPNSGGVWAPCLTWDDGVFYLVYTDVKRWVGSFKDAHNYVVTSTSIEGPWSEPVYLNSSGFDPSLYHDRDGRKWLLNMRWDHRPEKNAFSGILLQEYDAKSEKLVGPIKNIFDGSKLGLVEGPHLYFRDGYYYLFTAEGGTFATHAETVARSKNIDGPYEIMPGNPLITSAYDPSLALQSAGHGCPVELEDGSTLFAYLCRRQLDNGRSILGRETAIQRLVWDDDGWPRLAEGGNTPAVIAQIPDLPEHPWPKAPARTAFNDSKLDPAWQSLRVPISKDWLSLEDRPGFLRLYGRESIQSHYDQSLIARRVTTFHSRATTVMEFDPQSFQQMAGLAAFYSTDNFYYLYVSQMDHTQRGLGLMKCERGQVSYPVEKEVPIDGSSRIFLRAEINLGYLGFSYSLDGNVWKAIFGPMDASILSDEFVVPVGFTGAFYALVCQDMSGVRKHADFEWFDYEELGE